LNLPIATIPRISSNKEKNRAIDPSTISIRNLSRRSSTINLHIRSHGGVIHKANYSEEGLKDEPEHGLRVFASVSDVTLMNPPYLNQKEADDSSEFEFPSAWRE